MLKYETIRADYRLFNYVRNTPHCANRQQWNEIQLCTWEHCDSALNARQNWRMKICTGGKRGIAPLILNPGTKRGWVTRPGSLTPGKKPGCPLNRGFGVPQSRCGSFWEKKRKVLPLPRLKPRKIKNQAKDYLTHLHFIYGLFNDPVSIWD